MRALFGLRPCAAVLFAFLLVTCFAATIELDGIIDAAYGAPTAIIPTNISAPFDNYADNNGASSSHGPPTMYARIGYNISRAQDSAGIYLAYSLDPASPSFDTSNYIYEIAHLDACAGANYGRDLAIQIISSDAGAVEAYLTAPLETSGVYYTCSNSNCNTATSPLQWAKRGHVLEIMVTTAGMQAFMASKCAGGINPGGRVTIEMTVVQSRAVDTTVVGSFPFTEAGLGYWNGLNTAATTEAPPSSTSTTASASPSSTSSPGPSSSAPGSSPSSPSSTSTVSTSATAGAGTSTTGDATSSAAAVVATPPASPSVVNKDTVAIAGSVVGAVVAVAGVVLGLWYQRRNRAAAVRIIKDFERRNHNWPTLAEFRDNMVLQGNPVNKDNDCLKIIQSLAKAKIISWNGRDPKSELPPQPGDRIYVI